MADPTTAEPLLVESRIAPPLQATSYSEVLDELAAFAARQPAVKDGERFLRQVSSLGADDTIAVGGGAFLPHLRSDAVDRVVVALGMTDRPLRVPNETGEESRGRLFALVAAPPDAVAAYLETVASLTALFRQEGVVDTILEARDPGAVARLPEVREAPRVQNLSVIDVMEPPAVAASWAKMVDAGSTRTYRLPSAPAVHLTFTRPAGTFMTTNRPVELVERSPCVYANVTPDW